MAGRAGVRSDRMLLLAVPCAAAADPPLHSAARFDYVRGFAPVSSLGLALAALAAAHCAAGFDSPREAAEVRAVRAGIRRELGTERRGVAPLLSSWSALAALLSLGWAGLTSSAGGDAGELRKCLPC